MNPLFSSPNGRIPSIPLSALLIEAPPRRHFAQLYRDLEPLGRAVHTYVETGLRRGASLVLLTCAETRDLFLQNLRESGIDIDECHKSGRPTMLDAESLRSHVMRGACPDRQAFYEVVKPVLENATRRGSSSTRVYGDLVNLLWRDGLPAAAAEVEGYWNEIMESYPFSLFCAYLLNGQDTGWESGLHEICRRHTDVILGGPGHLFEGGQFGVHIGELCDYGIDCCEDSATRLWVMADPSVS